MLVDARRQGDGYRLLIVSVANELGGSRTSLYCFEWSAQPAAGTVRQGGGVGRIAQVPGTRLAGAGSQRRATSTSTIRNNCVWS